MAGLIDHGAGTRRGAPEAANATLDLSGPIELAPRVWWVGAMLAGDDFQCHTYLIEQGDQSVLIDPGSALTWGEVRRKVDQVVGLQHVRWFVASHQDPDIIASLPAIEAGPHHPEAAVVTHWRSEALIKHIGTSLPFWRVEDHDWRLELEDRTLQFVFTPYLHFAGAFTTFDPSSGVLFSSDLFGAFTVDERLFATDIGYFEQLRSFHEHYMPGRDALVHSLDRLAELPIRTIAPQHGCVIPEQLVGPIIERLGQLECGLFLLARDDPGLAWLLRANEVRREVLDTLVEERSFPAVAQHLVEISRRMLPLRTIEFWAPTAGARMLVFRESERFSGTLADAPRVVEDVLHRREDEPLRLEPDGDGWALCIPLQPSGGRRLGVAVIRLHDRLDLDRNTVTLLHEISELVEVAVEREVARRTTDLDRAELYERSIRDPLTGLHNRLYMRDAMARLVAIDERSAIPMLAAVMIDLDHFKAINDTHGHAAGDEVLRAIGAVLTERVRAGDLAVRYGGEEFALFLVGVDGAGAHEIVDRLRTEIQTLDFGGSLAGRHVTMSAGVAMRAPGETADALLARADDALYAAKRAGRDQVRLAS